MIALAAARGMLPSGPFSALLASWPGGNAISPGQPVTFGARVVEHASRSRKNAGNALVAVRTGAGRRRAGSHPGDQVRLAEQGAAHRDEVESLAHRALDRVERADPA